MFFPIRTDRQLKSTPWVNYALIFVNVAVFAWLQHDIMQSGQLLDLMAQGRADFTLEQLIQQYPVLSYHLWPPGSPAQTHLLQFVTCQFLHAHWPHLIGNMIFLFVFGNATEDRMGKLGYLLFYLAGGIVAGIGHVVTSDAPVLGASGAVAAVSGAYLALFPKTYVTIVYWFIVIGAFEVASLYLILFYFLKDLMFFFVGYGNVAYTAHLAGNAFGFAMGMGLLLGRLLAREPYDMLSLIEHRHRREKFKKLTTRGGYQPWEAGKPGKAAGKPPAPATPEQVALMERRARISAALADHNAPEAARRYVELIEDHPDQVMGQNQQIDIASQLMAEGYHAQSAHAYELFLKTYPAYAQRHPIMLVLALLHAKYLKNPDRARQLLTEALPKLDGDEKQLAQHTLDSLK